MRKFVLSVWLLLGLAPRSFAQPPDDKMARARVHVNAAVAYYDDGKYEDAVREMQAAYELKPVPDLQYDLAQCYERLGKPAEAADAYERYLNGKPGAPDRKQV